MTFYTIHPRELEDIMRRKHGILIDVREADSYREYHYPNVCRRTDRWCSTAIMEAPVFWRRESSAERGMRYIPWLAALRQCEQVIDREN